MASNRKKVEVNSLEEGMYVSDLDRPWHETPFPLQGFYIRQDDDVKALAEFCKFVYVDVDRQREAKDYAKHAPVKTAKKDSKTGSKGQTGDAQGAKVLKLPPIRIKNPRHYEQTTAMAKEVAKANKLHKQVYEALDLVFMNIHRGAEVSLVETEKVATGMVESVVRNPDALSWLAKMSENDAYTYQHSVKASIWALVFGRHLGLEKDMLKTLAMGGLLSHVGKAKVPHHILEKYEGRTTQEQLEYESYVEKSVEILDAMDNLSKGVVAVAKFHQERHNGTGFPEGLTGDRIPLLAKIAGLVDHYQMLITPREEKLGLSPLEAVTKLFELRDLEFQSDLVERFIEAVGVYPTGTLVELSSKEVGIVTGHNVDRRLLPKVMIVLDEHKNPLKHGKLVDLKEYNKGRRQDDFIVIKDSLPKGAYDIDEAAYLLSGATSKWSWKHFSHAFAG